MIINKFLFVSRIVIVLRICTADQHLLFHMCCHSLLTAYMLVSIDAAEGHEYARVLKYNFSKEELSVLIDAISLIKSLSSLMCRAEATLSPYIRFHIHHRIQQLVQV